MSFSSSAERANQVRPPVDSAEPFEESVPVLGGVRDQAVAAVNPAGGNYADGVDDGIRGFRRVHQIRFTNPARVVVAVREEQQQRSSRTGLQELQSGEQRIVERGDILLQFSDSGLFEAS